MIHAALAFIADTLEDGEVYFSHGTLPHRRLDPVEEFEHFGFVEWLVGMKFVQRLRYFGGSARAVAQM